MGNKSSSTSNQKYDTAYVNTTDTKLLNKSINSFASDVVSNQAQNCSAGITQLQEIDIRGITGDGDVVIGGSDQSQTSNVTFDCVQVASIKNDIGNGALTKYMDALENNFSTDALDKMEAVAATSSKNSLGGFGSSSSNSKANVDYQFKSTNTTRTNIENVVKNSIQNNLSMESIANCISSVISKQSYKLKDIESKTGSVTIGAISQTQGATLMTNCLQTADNGNKITNAVAAELGVTLDNTSSQKKTTEIKTTAVAESANEGVGEAAKQTLEGAGDAAKQTLEGVSTVVSSVGDLFSEMYVPCIIFVILLVVVGIIAAFVFKYSQGGQSNSDMQDLQDLQDQQEGGFYNIKQIGKALIRFNKNK